MSAACVSGVEAVVFDWGGTLTPWHTIDLAEQWLVFARTLLPKAPDEAAALAVAIHAVEARSWRRVRDSDDHGSARLAEILAEAGVDDALPTYGAACDAYREFWEPHTITDPAVAPMLTALHERGVAVGVLSNTIWPGEWHDDWFARDGVLELFDARTYSSGIDWIKPSPHAYRAAISALGVADPGRCVYVGDRVYEDVHGAQQAGLRAIWVPHSDIPADQLVEGVTAEPDGVAKELGDVVTLVDAWS